MEISTLLDYFTFGVKSVDMEDLSSQISLIDKTERIRMYDDHAICSRNFLMLSKTAFVASGVSAVCVIGLYISPSQISGY
jgi:hypothetical protein